MKKGTWIGISPRESNWYIKFFTEFGLLKITHRLMRGFNGVLVISEFLIHIP